MNNLDQLMEHIKVSEGFRDKVYRCPAGKLTIGFGRNLEDNGITEEEALILLENDLEKIIADLDLFLPWWVDMTPRRRMVLIDMAYNLGIDPAKSGKLMTFTKTLSEMQQGNYSKAADMMLESKWAKQVGVRARKLARWMRDG